VAKLAANVDAWIEQDIPAKNHGDAVKIRLRGAATSKERRGLVFFPRPFPLGATILSAVLRVHLDGAWSGIQTLTIGRLTAPWKEGEVNWSNQPAVSATNLVVTTVVNGVDNQEVASTITAMMQDVSAGQPYYGLLLLLNVDSLRNLHSSDSPEAEYRPTLEITWAEPPAAPTNLRPSGGQVISVAKPVLAWEFEDRHTQDSQTASEIEISTTTDFTTPEYDSGKQANTDAQWDLAATAYGGVPAGATRYWRMRVWNEGDLVSPWSATESFKRVAQGTLTITSPAAAPNNFVEETTPPLSWTFTGATQEERRVILYRIDPDDLTLTEIYEWPREVTTQTSVTVPDTAAVWSETKRGPPVLKTGETYQEKVTVWDSEDRVGLAGDPAGVSATRNFTYQRSGIPAAVVVLTATASATEPKVRLHWERGAQPDYFALKVDGVEVLTRIDPDDVFVSGTSYEMDWWRSSGGVQHTYEIEAVVLDGGKLKHSDGNATAAATTKVIGKWLVDDFKEPALTLQIADRQQTDLSIGDSGETLYPRGSRAPVRISDTPRGYEGSLAGTTIAAGDRDNFLTLKARQRELRYLQKSLNLPVRLGAVQLAPSSDNPGEFYVVAAEIFQVDEFFSLKG
jgi:hypothetical protein